MGITQFIAAIALIASATACPTSPPTIARRADPVPTLTGELVKLPAGAFGPEIEGVSVNEKGDAYAVDYRGGGTANHSALGFFSLSDSGTAKVLDLNPIAIVPENATPTPPYLSGSRFVPGKILLADASNKRVYSWGLNNEGLKVFCADNKMLQPNDIAVSTNTKKAMIFLSGQNYTADTTAGLSGDLWTCECGKPTQFDPAILAKAGIHRTNGIETSPDGKRLYLSSAENKGGKVISNKIFQFALDPATGKLLNQAPTLFYDFTDSPAVDVDGMRADTKGNLFVTRNGDGKIVELSPEGKLLAAISLPGMGGPSNLEFGGPKGSTLFAVGKCADDATAGCVSKVQVEGSVGKAFASFQ